MKRVTFLIIILLLLSNNCFAQEGNAQNKERINYRRTDSNNLPPTTIYQQPKEQVFPLGWRTNTLGKVTTGTGAWTELNPKVPRVDYLGIHFLNPDTGWACGDLGALIKTTDGGSSWIVSETHTTTPILKVRSYNGQVVIASGFNGLILRSTDGGETFTSVTSGVAGDLWGLQMTNDTLGWVCGTANSLAKTTDGGLTWQTVPTPGYTSDYWWIDFLTEYYGFIAANGKVLRTIDGGQNWEIIQAGDNQPLFCVDAIDSLHIVAAGYGGTGYSGKNIYSSDGGFTWINGGDLTFESVNSVQYVNVDTGYVVMTNVSARKTTNRGQNWTIIGGLDDNYELQFFKEINIGYSAGTILKINKAEGNLNEWNRLILNDTFSDVYFTSELTGYVVSRWFYKTTNSGLSWVMLPNFPINAFTTTLGCVTFTDSITGFVGGPPCRIVKTTDAGDTWQITNRNGLADTLGSINKIFFINATTGWAVTSRGGILKTTDSGDNWFAQLNGASYEVFRSIFFIDSLIGWVLSPIYSTTNGGENWIRRADIQIYNGSDIFFINSNGFIINFLELDKTTDSGNNWFTQFHSQYVLRNFGWLSSKHGFVIGDGVYETVDSGNAWNEILELRNIGLRKFQAPKNYIGYSTGNLGLIFKYLDTAIVPVELSSFFAETNNDMVSVKWSTATEVNNVGFELLRSSDNQIWNFITFINGNGTTTLKHSYEFTDQVETSGIYYYKLKQIDYNGKYEYSNIIEVRVNSPLQYNLAQNYSNPFNPSTTIKYSVKAFGKVKLILYDMLGGEVAVLTDEVKEPGYYEVNFDASGLPSGVYFYKLIAGDYINTKKMLLLK